MPQHYCSGRYGTPPLEKWILQLARLDSVRIADDSLMRRTLVVSSSSDFMTVVLV
jgi:hypothetical protein